MSTPRTTPDDATAEVERHDAAHVHPDAGPMPTEAEELAADRAAALRSDVDRARVREAEQDLQQKGAHVQGEGRVE